MGKSKHKKSRSKATDTDSTSSTEILGLASLESQDDSGNSNEVENEGLKEETIKPTEKETAAKTYRAIGLPRHFTADLTADRLCSLLGLDPVTSQLKVHSLAPSPYYNSAQAPSVATFTFEGKCPALSTLPERNSLPLQLEDADFDGPSPMTRRITVDRNFEGFTPLNAIYPEEDHQIECVPWECNRHLTSANFVAASPSQAWPATLSGHGRNKEAATCGFEILCRVTLGRFAC